MCPPAAATVAAVGLALVLVLPGCGGGSDEEPEAEAASTACVVPDGGALAPEDGILAGVNLDWANETLAEYSDSLGHRPAVAVTFAAFPMGEADGANVAAAFEQVVANGGILLLTLEPRQGLAAVTEPVADELAGMLDGFNRQGVPVIVRFAHEMNGSWYEWGQQPGAYVDAFRIVADAVHRDAPGTATMWAPNYGGGYPFVGGAFAAAAGSEDFSLLDTDGDGQVTGADDPYAPYYPGDEAVDWVGMSLYHWGDTYPWGANVVAEPGKLVEQLTGTYDGAGGNDLAVPDFHADYGVARAKPVAIPETAALFVPGTGGDDELAVKQAWWEQLFDPAVLSELPALRMVNWFEWQKDEPEVGAVVDWRATATDSIRAGYTAALPEWFRFAEPPVGCAPGSG